MKIARRLLCTILLLVFTSEYVAATTAHEPAVDGTHDHQFNDHQLQGHFFLLAEESEERDDRESDFLPLEHFFVYVCHAPSAVKRNRPELLHGVTVTIPRYTLHRSFLI